MIEVTAIPAFDDNSIWALHDGQSAVIVDPGDAVPVLAWMARTGHRLAAILLTHHHGDHIGGVAGLLAAQAVPVIGHREDAHRLPALSLAVSEGDTVTLPILQVQLLVIATPGHTLGHICYYGAGLLFCGDTLFSAGCGRMFEGHAEQYEKSLSRLAALPADTRVFAAHEYTVSNLSFAAALTPQDESLQANLLNARRLRAEGHATLPSSIGWERRHNPFLRCHEKEIAVAVGLPHAPPSTVFAAIRRAKDNYRGV